MPRYIDADALVEDFDNDVHCLRLGGLKGTPRPLEISLKNVIERIEEALTCDVVPRSEYEDLEFQFKELDIECDRLEKVEEKLQDYKRVFGELVINNGNNIVLIGDNVEFIDRRVAEGFKNLAVKQAKQELAREMSVEMEHEIAEALKSNYKALSEFEEADELYYRVKGKIDALRGIQDFLAELEKKYI